jgi:hypothetical protein
MATCKHCGQAIEHTFGEWRHVETGSMFCRKVRGVRPTPVAAPKEEGHP